MTREEKINYALLTHHEKAKQYNSRTIMTVLCGSQNYGLDTENSDYDTYSFVLPSIDDMASLKDPVSTLKEDELGHINLKDIRLALGLLLKTSPNSVEWFATKYRVIEPEYKNLFREYITGFSLRCNTKHMMDAIGGMSHQLVKRNMPAGKRFSHILRMESMVDNYINFKSDILSVRKDLIPLALEAKLDPDNEKYNEMCIEHEKVIQEKIASADLESIKSMDHIGVKNVEELRLKLMKQHIEKERLAWLAIY